MLGIRIPLLRKIARRIARGDWRAFLDSLEVRYFEERLIEGLVIGYAACPIEEKLERVARFVPRIDNWAVSVCFVRLPARTRPWLENDCPLDDWTFNRSLQKIRESYRTDSADKAALRQLKRPAKRTDGNSRITK